MDDLIARLEAATEGSRELDAYIWAAIHCPGQPVRIVEPPTWKERRYFCNPDAATDWIGYDLLNVAEHFTTSLDAALMLVPEIERTAWSISQNPDRDDRRPCAVIMPERSSARRDGEAFAATPALALCIAALKAHGSGGVAR